MTEIDSEQKSIVNPYFSDVAKDYVYKANIEAFGNSFGGIFIVKKLGDEHHRIVFTTEIGNKIFDFSFQGDNFKVKHILKKLDKKVLINILKNDFKVLVKEHPDVEKVFQKKAITTYETQIGNKKYYHSSSEERLTKVIRVGSGKEKVKFLFSEINDNIAKDIQILHQNFNLTIILRAL